MKTFTEYRIDCDGMTVYEALEILVELRVEDQKIVICGEHGNYAMTVWDYCENIPGNMCASQIQPIQFCAGPPNCFSWITGNLNQFVMDKLMYRDAKLARKLLV